LADELKNLMPELLFIIVLLTMRGIPPYEKDIAPP
jgi:hypothetical protein